MELTRESLRPLLDLQQVDVAIDRLQALRAELPEQLELDRLSAQLDAARTVLAERELETGAFTREQDKFEAEVAALEAKIKHETDRLYGGEVSSPKELTSIQAELDGLRRRKSHIEDQLLDLMEKREAADAALAESKDRAALLQQQKDAAAAARDDAATHIASDLEARQAEREALVPRIPPEALEMYEDLRPKKEGVAIAALEGGVCRGCMVALSPVALDAIKRSDDPLVRCENCRRLLVIVRP